jgi:molybdenum cofactor cytidylyltransferase
VAVVLLAAGESTRMQQPKQLLSWHGLPLLRYQLQELARLPQMVEVVVVLGHRAKEFAGLAATGAGMQAVKAVVNEAYVEGKAGSIRTGVAAVQSAPDALMVLAVDQPRPAAVLEGVRTAHARGTALITVPSHRGRRGHPPLFSRVLRDELLVVTEEGQGLREIMGRHRDDVQTVEMEDPIVLLNLNTEQDYREGLKQFPQLY